METNLKKKILSLIIIWIGIISSLSIFTIIVYFGLYNKSEIPLQNIQSMSFTYFSYLVTLISIPGTYILYKNISKKAILIQNEDEKFNYYKKAVFFKFFILEFAGLSTLVAFYISSQSQIIYMTGILIVILISSKPSENQFNKDFFDENSNTFLENENEENSVDEINESDNNK